MIRGVKGDVIHGCLVEEHEELLKSRAGSNLTKQLKLQYMKWRSQYQSMLLNFSSFYKGPKLSLQGAC